MRKNEAKSLQERRFRGIFGKMESSSKLHDTWDAFSHRDLAAEILAAWKRASAVAGVQGKREVDSGRSVLGVASMAGSGFAYPGVVRRVPVVQKNDADDQEDHREAPFNRKSKSKKS